MTKRVCNLCGEDFDGWDEQEGFGLVHKMGYGSEYDGELVEIDLCCDCFDKLLKHLIPKCKISPIVEDSLFG